MENHMIAKRIKRPSYKGNLVKHYQEFVPYVDTKSIQHVPHTTTKPSGAGIYALYDKHGLYYIGLATRSIRGRLKVHARSKKRKWERFSWYHVPNMQNVKDIETLFIRIVRPRGNLVRGKFPRSARVVLSKP